MRSVLTQVGLARWLKWPPCPHIVKVLWKTSIPEREAETCYEALGTKDLTRLFSWWLLRPIYGKLKAILLPCIFIWGKYRFIYEKCFKVFWWGKKVTERSKAFLVFLRIYFPFCLDLFTCIKSWKMYQHLYWTKFVNWTIY